MADKVKITDRKLKALKPGKELIDTIESGFRVRCDERGRKTFQLYTRFPRSPYPTRRPLGEYPSTSLAEAREKAGAWNKSIKRGIDPAVAEEQERQAKLREQAVTFGSVAADWIEHKKAEGHENAEQTERDINNAVGKAWSKRPITGIKQADVASVIRGIVKRGRRGQAHHVFSHLSAMFNWAIGTGAYGIEISPLAYLKPAALGARVNRRKRVLTDQELRAFWNATPTLGYPWHPIYRLLLLTALRIDVVCSPEWGEIDLARRLWTIPPRKMKMRNDFVLPLTDGMIEVINTIPKIGNNKHLFPDGTGKPLGAHWFAEPKKMLDELMGNALGAPVQHWVNHSLRHTIRTKLPELGVLDAVAETVLAHSKKGIEANYNHHAYVAERRKALNIWQRYIALVLDASLHESVMAHRDHVSDDAERDRRHDEFLEAIGQGGQRWTAYLAPFKGDVAANVVELKRNTASHVS